ncbi:hypothetical protein SDJN02_10867, partial [Cucurbita argyrosperma subsp. argyrosperma]
MIPPPSTTVPIRRSVPTSVAEACHLNVYPTSISLKYILLPATAIPNVPAPPICDAAPVGLSAGGPSGADEGGEATRGTTGPPAGDPEGVIGAGVGALVSGAGVGDAGVREGAGVAGAGGRGCEGPRAGAGAGTGAGA